MWVLVWGLLGLTLVGVLGLALNWYEQRRMDELAEYLENQRKKLRENSYR